MLKPYWRLSACDKLTMRSESNGMAFMGKFKSTSFQGISNNPASVWRTNWLTSEAGAVVGVLFSVLFSSAVGVRFSVVFSALFLANVLSGDAFVGDRFSGEPFVGEQSGGKYARDISNG